MITREEYLSYCSYYDHHGGMPEEIKKLVANVTYTDGKVTKTDCFKCGEKVHYHLPKMNPQEKRRYADLVGKTLSDEEKEFTPYWRIEEDLFILYLCHECGAWFVDERWSDIH